MAHALAVPRSFLYAHPEYILDAETQNRLQKLVNRRLDGEPMAYILGEKEFWSLNLLVNGDTMIPRPETELLVELILEKFTEPSSRHPCQGDISISIADLGTGCGAIAIALASSRPHWQITATDQSAAALQVAVSNAQRLHLSNVTFYQGSWCAALPKKHFTAIVSNPPYIRANDPHLRQGDLRFEPQAALIGGSDGLAAFREIITQAPDYLIDGAWLLLEHGYDQGHSVRDLMQAAGFQAVETRQDLAGIDRVTLGILT